MVFHTAPPHPASNARMTCSPQLVGGPEASQKGFGQRMPAKLVVRSAMRCLRLGRLTHDRQRSAFSVSHRIHDLAAAVHAIAAGIVFRVGGPARRAVYDD